MLGDKPETGPQRVVVHRRHRRGGGQSLAQRLNHGQERLGRRFLGFHHDDQPVQDPEVPQEIRERHDRGGPARHDIQQFGRDGNPYDNGGGQESREQAGDGDATRVGVYGSGQSAEPGFQHQFDGFRAIVVLLTPGRSTAPRVSAVERCGQRPETRRGGAGPRPGWDGRPSRERPDILKPRARDASPGGPSEKNRTGETADRRAIRPRRRAPAGGRWAWCAGPEATGFPRVQAGSRPVRSAPMGSGRCSST